VIDLDCVCLDAKLLSQPTVSAVMAVHQGVDLSYLKESVFSILGQIDVLFEFIIIADGPLNDYQYDFLNEIVDQNTNVSFCQLSKNLGPGAARNFAIDRARGRYVAIMDSDDVALPHRLSKQVSYLESHPEVSVVGSSCIVIDEYGQASGSRCLPLTSKQLFVYAPFFCPLNNPTVMARAKILKCYPYKEGFRSGEDHRLWLELLNAGFHLANIEEPLLKFRIDSDLYKRRVGLHKANTDLLNRVYGLRIVSVYRKPLVLLVSLMFYVLRFLPVRVVKFMTSWFDSYRTRKMKNNVASK